MKKTLLAFVIGLFIVITLAFTISAEEITVTDDGTSITLGECVIEGLNKEIPSPSAGFTFVLNTETKTAKITKWANYADKEKGVTLVIPSTVTYNDVTYTVTTFDKIVHNSDNGAGGTSNGNFVVVNVYIPDTVKAIPSSAFAFVRSLEYFYAGGGITSVGESAFNEAGFTAGAYKVDNGSGKMVSIEATGENMGEIKEFVITSNQIELLGVRAFYNMEFSKSATVKVNVSTVKTFSSYCLAMNPYHAQSGHYYNGIGIVLDYADIRNAETIASNAFERTYGVRHLVLNADQVHLFKLYHSYREVATVYEIYGGETADSAVALSYKLFSENLQHYNGATVNKTYIFHGYIDACADQIDGMTYTWVTNYVQINYCFASMDTFNHYINSVKGTSNGSDILTRYNDYEKGYFVICDNTNGHKATDNKLVYDSSTGAYNLSVVNDTYELPTYSETLDGKCTESTLCIVCDTELKKGLDHDLVTNVAYANGYLLEGVKSVACQREGCNHLSETPVKAIFTFKGFSTNNDNTELCIGYYVDAEALAEYNAYNDDLVYGVIATVVDENENLTLSYNEGIVSSSLDNTIIAPVGSTYSGFEFKLSGFKDKAEGDTVDLKALNLVMSAYVYDGSFYYLGSTESLTDCKKEASTITFAEIQAKVIE